ncbi:SPRY-domain-containing protein [Gigaspora margarita]|uniref:SPRY-domain-containing protein n=1 Tax=Gigaspora margarita TaxID=4874 RepID=A0A8H4A8I1_GIGMA|nr:SPRY-domain-containing protein [Gigaspora margarita]
MTNIKNDKSLPFIPQYLRDSPLDIYNKTANTPISLPTKFNKNDRARCVQVMDKELIIRHAGGGTSSSIRTDHPIPRNAGVYYFEINLLNDPASVGLARKRFYLERHPGWEIKSIGYHGDDGMIYYESGHGSSYGPPFATGDTVGCCINYCDQKIFFTKNGVNLGIACKKIFAGKLYPVIGMHTYLTQIEINFGAKPFKFDIEHYAKSVFTKAMLQQYKFFTIRESEKYLEDNDEFVESDYETDEYETDEYPVDEDEFLESD